MSNANPNNFSIAFDREKKRMLVTRWGVLDKDNVIQTHRAVHEAKEFNPEYDTIVDFQEITKVDLCYNDLKEIHKAERKIEKRAGCSAMVTGQNTGRYLFAKLFCEGITANPWSMLRYKAFRTIEEAERWLDAGS